MQWLPRTMSSRLQLSSLLSSSKLWIARSLSATKPIREFLSLDTVTLGPYRPSLHTTTFLSGATPPRSMATDLDDKPATPKLKLYSYWRSSCSQRVRIVLNLKGLDYEYKAVNLLKNEQAKPEFEELNPVKYVPALVDGETVIADSFAIIMYLDEKYPQPPLLPRDDLQKKALNIQVASIVGSSIQPLQNIPVLSYIEDKFNSDEVIAWAQHHIGRGFTALEKLLQGCAGRYATGDEVQMADVFLAPQISAGIVRFRVDMSQFPTLARLHEAYAQHPSFQAADPTKQPDSTSAA